MSKRLLAFAVVLVAFAFAGVGNAFGATLIVDDDAKANAPTLDCDSPMPAPTSIEAAHETSPGADTVYVCPGTYTEQVSFEPEDSNTTIRSVVRRQAVIQAPFTIVTNLVDEKSIVHVNAATGIRILAFTISGPGPSICDSIRYGVWVENGGSATIDDNHVKDIRDTDLGSLDPPISGCQNGVGIQIGRRYTDGPTTGTATITRNLIDGYQKNGMTIDNVGSSANVVGNVVRGAGPTPVIAQNGIQVSRGAFAVVRENEVSDNIYTGPFMAVASSSGILLYGDAVDPSPAPGTTVADNLVYRNDDNIPAFGTQLARILDNRVLGATRFDGIYMGVDSANNRIEGNFLRNNAEHDCHDDSGAPPPSPLVLNLWIDNDGLTDNRGGSLCEIDDDDDDEDDDDDDDDDADDDDDRGDEG